VKDQSGDDPKKLDRIIFFSDAVFAIVMTLLVLDIPIPEYHRVWRQSNCRVGYSTYGPSF